MVPCRPAAIAAADSAQKRAEPRATIRPSYQSQCCPESRTDSRWSSRATAETRRPRDLLGAAGAQEGIRRLFATMLPANSDFLGGSCDCGPGDSYPVTI